MSKINLLHKKRGKSYPEKYTPISLLNSFEKTSRKNFAIYQWILGVRNIILRSLCFQTKKILHWCYQSSNWVSGSKNWSWAHWESLLHRSQKNNWYIESWIFFISLDYGSFRGPINELLPSYLSDRREYISWNGTKSTIYIIMTSAP